MLNDGEYEARRLAAELRCMPICEASDSGYGHFSRLIMIRSGVPEVHVGLWTETDVLELQQYQCIIQRWYL